MSRRGVFIWTEKPKHRKPADRGLWLSPLRPNVWPTRVRMNHKMSVRGGREPDETDFLYTEPLPFSSFLSRRPAC